MKFYRLVLKILSGSKYLTPVKGHDPVTNVRKMMCNNPNLDLVDINAYTIFGEILKILSGNKILTSIRGHKPVLNLRKMTGNNPNLDLVNINAHTVKSGQIISVGSRDIERKETIRHHSRAITM